MILVTRLNGSPFAVNPDLLERVESTPDTVLTLIDGTKYIVTESLTDVIARVREYRASIVASARDAADLAHASTEGSERRLHLAAAPPAPASSALTEEA